MTTEQFSPLRYHGSRSRYVDIAIRGNEEHLGLGADYVIHPNTGQGCIILRFVVHGDGVQPKNFKHLMYRESAQFVTHAPSKSPEVFKGVRLNKIAIPVFEPAVGPHEIDKFAEKFGIWLLLEEWISEQVQAEGFMLTVNLLKELRQLVFGVEDQTAVKSVIEFPDLKSQESQTENLKLVKKPEEDPEPDEDSDDEDGGNKEWLQ